MQLECTRVLNPLACRRDIAAQFVCRLFPSEQGSGTLPLPLVIGLGLLAAAGLALPAVLHLAPHAADFIRAVISQLNGPTIVRHMHAIFSLLLGGFA
jgi:hypothetical protein